MAHYKEPYSDSHRVILWFWTYWRELGTLDAGLEGSKALLRFITGSERVPLDGMSPPFTIVEASDLGPDSLPRAHTCFNTLALPAYPSYARLKLKLEIAVTEGGQHFGLT